MKCCAETSSVSQGRRFTGQAGQVESRESMEGEEKRDFLFSEAENKKDSNSQGLLLV